MAYDPLSGFSQASETYNRITQLETQRLQQMAQEEYQQEQIKASQEKREAEKRAKQEEEYEKWKMEQLLKRSADAAFPNKLIAQGSNADQVLAEQLRKTAFETLKTDPAGALELFDKASKLKQSAATGREADLRIKGLQTERTGEILAGINSQESLNEAVPRLAEFGVVLPPQFQKWNDATSKYLQSQSLMSSKVAQAERLKLQAERDAAKAAKLQSDAAAKELKANNDRMKEANRQSNIVAGRALKAADLSPDELSIIRKELKGNDLYDDLSGEDQITAAKDVEAMSVYLLHAEPGITLPEARKKAKQLVFEGIKEGKYTTPQMSGKTTPGKEIPSLEDWMRAAKKANPNVSEEDLNKYYNNKYKAN